MKHVVTIKKTFVLGKGQKAVILSEGWQTVLQQACEGSKKQGSELVRRKVQLDDLAYVVYSSGTTGKPKGERNDLYTAGYCCHLRFIYRMLSTVEADNFFECTPAAILYIFLLA